MRIIALIGPKRSGKTEVAKILRMHGFTCVKFAQPLKDMILSLPGITKEHVEEDLKDLPCDVFNGKTVRHAMQTLGTEWGRNCIDQDIWLSLWKEKIKGEQFVVVDDCRFANEADAVRDMGGEVWEIKREGRSYDGHSSETGMINIKADLEIANNGMISDLQEKIMFRLNWNKDWRSTSSRVMEGSDA
jgi:hypothetical protein